MLRLCGLSVRVVLLCVDCLVVVSDVTVARALLMLFCLCVAYILFVYYV